MAEKVEVEKNLASEESKDEFSGMNNKVSILYNGVKYPISIDDNTSVNDLKDLFLEDLNKSLNKHFGFTTFKNNYKANFSRNIDLKLSNKNFDRIIEMNKIDMEIYEYVQKSKKRY